MHVYMHVYSYIHRNTYIYIYIQACMYSCGYSHKHICIHMSFTYSCVYSHMSTHLHNIFTRDIYVVHTSIDIFTCLFASVMQCILFIYIVPILNFRGRERSILYKASLYSYVIFIFICHFYSHVSFSYSYVIFTFVCLFTYIHHTFTCL